jgi:hypothetical protein
MNNLEHNIRKSYAVKNPDGSWLDRYGHRKWFNDSGLLHREDGPAVIYKDTDLLWCLNGVPFEFTEWLKITPISDEAKMMLRLQYA